MLTKVEPEQEGGHMIEVGHRQLLVHLNPEVPETVTEMDGDDRLAALLVRILPAPLDRFDYQWFCYDDHGWDVFVIRYCDDE